MHATKNVEILMKQDTGSALKRAESSLWTGFFNQFGASLFSETKFVIGEKFGPAFRPSLSKSCIPDRAEPCYRRCWQTCSVSQTPALLQGRRPGSVFCFWTLWAFCFCAGSMTGCLWHTMSKALEKSRNTTSKHFPLSN